MSTPFQRHDVIHENVDNPHTMVFVRGNANYKKTIRTVDIALLESVIGDDTQKRATACKTQSSVEKVEELSEESLLYVHTTIYTFSVHRT